MQGKERLEAYLREHQVPFQVQRHARTLVPRRLQKVSTFLARWLQKP